MNFVYSKRYREDQSAHAGRVLVTALNGNSCLDPQRQALEVTLPRFSYLTQIIDDVADIAEDLKARRPSYAVGALVDHPHELQNARHLIAERGIAKVTPRLLQIIAPEAYKQIQNTFLNYCADLEKTMGQNGRTIGLLAQGVFNYFPHVRDILYRIDPNVANF